MDELELESRLGRFKKEYTPAFGKVVFNVIFMLIWFFLGFFVVSMLWGFYDSRGTAIVVGLIFLVTGLGYVIVPLWRRFGRRARLYDEGVWIRIRGKEQDWRFEEIEGVRVIPGRSSIFGSAMAPRARASAGLIVRDLVSDAIGAGVDVAGSARKLTRAAVYGYEFYVGGERVFDVKPSYKRWKELGAEVFLGVMTPVVTTTVEQVRRGEPVVYDNYGPDKAMHLLVAAEVIKQLEWEAWYGAP